MVLHKVVCTGLDHHIDSPTVEQDQRFLGLKTTKIDQQDFRHDT